MIKAILTFLSIILLSISFSSCKMLRHKKSNRKKVEAAIQNQKIDSLSSLIKTEVLKVDTNIENNYLIDSTAHIWQKKIEFKTFSAKSKMHYEGAEKFFDFTANIRMQKDSIIWVSVNVAGIVQVARAIITPDSFKAILYTEKEFYEGPISKANKILPEGIDFYSLQNLILGNSILNSIRPSFVQRDSNQTVFRKVYQNYIEQLNFQTSDTTLRSSQLLTSDVTNKSLSNLYGNFILLNVGNFSTERRLNIVSEMNKILVEMSLSNINFDTELSYPFSVPKNYTHK